MKRVLKFLLLVVFLLVMPSVFATDVLTAIADNVKFGYENELGKFVELDRTGNYAFEGEKIIADVFVRDVHGVDFVQLVAVTIGPTQGIGNDIETSCISNLKKKSGIGGLRFNSATDRWYKCEFTVETPESMRGEYFIGVEAISTTENIMAQNFGSLYFLNPIVALSIDGDVSFENVTPGTRAYSNIILVSNDAEEGSGVLLDMFISGTDFYDPDNSNAICSTTNTLKLENLKYYASNAGFDTSKNKRADNQGYDSIPYSTSFSSSVAKILDNEGNRLAPGQEISTIFRLDLPIPCAGNFNEGSIFFWGQVANSGKNNQIIPNIGLGIGIDVTTLV